MMMRFVRFVLLLLVTLSVTVLPVAPSHAARAGTNDLVTVADPPDCGDHYGQPAGDNSGDGIDCMAMAQCAVACSASPAALVSAATLPWAATAASAPMLADAGIVSTIGRPPFRPPRI